MTNRRFPWSPSLVKERKGRQTGIFYSTECIDLDDYLELQDGPTPAPAKGRTGGKGNAVVDFECGCCEAALEGDVPQFCAGPPVCEGEQTNCDPEDRRDLRTRGGKGSGKPSDSTLICVGGTTRLSLRHARPGLSLHTRTKPVSLLYVKYPLGGPS
jgi:hypothetical protein